MQIEEGVCYETRSGKMAGPMVIRYGEWATVEDETSPFNGRAWKLNGVHDYGDTDLDLIAPWPTHADTVVKTPTTRSIYLSGPMEGYPQLNYPLFNAVTAQLRRAGHTVYNPAEFGSDKPYDGFPIRQAYAAFSKFICEEADAIVLLPGWENSKGANAERALADNCGIAIIAFESLSSSIITEPAF